MVDFGPRADHDWVGCHGLASGLRRHDNSERKRIMRPLAFRHVVRNDGVTLNGFGIGDVAALGLKTRKNDFVVARLKVEENEVCAAILTLDFRVKGSASGAKREHFLPQNRDKTKEHPWDALSDVHGGIPVEVMSSTLTLTGISPTLQPCHY